MTATKTQTSETLILKAATAMDLMKGNPVSIEADASVLDAAALLTDKGFSAAPVIDEAGRPIGVVSRSDLIAHDRERIEFASPVHDYYEEADINRLPGGKVPDGFQVVDVDRAAVEDIMTPVVFAVSPHTSAAKVVREMVALKVHRLFVVGDDGILIGVISATDILQHLV